MYRLFKEVFSTEYLPYYLIAGVFLLLCYCVCKKNEETKRLKRREQYQEQYYRERARIREVPVRDVGGFIWKLMQTLQDDNVARDENIRASVVGDYIDSCEKNYQKNHSWWSTT